MRHTFTMKKQQLFFLYSQSPQCKGKTVQCVKADRHKKVCKRQQRFCRRRFLFFVAFGTGNRPLCPVKQLRFNFLTQKTKKKGTACCRSLDLSSLLFVEAVLLVELVNTSACVNQLLLARKIGVTLVANFHLDDVGVFGCTRLERSATSTYNSRLMIIRMYTLFHFAHLADFFERFSFRAVLFYRKQKK